MSILYYANLPDVDDPTQLMMDAHYKLGQIKWHLNAAIWNAKKEVNELGWKADNSTNPEEGPVWIELIDPPNGKEIDGRIYQLFLRSKRIYESQDYISPYIRVIDKDFRNQMIKLSRIPSTESIFVRPNVYDLNQQLKAVTKLQTLPVEEHRSLLRLLESRSIVSWPEFELIEIEGHEWEFLDEDSIEGIENQRIFVQKGLSTTDFAILEGPPGSGKTTTICELIYQIVKRGKRVMLCASTHIAIDNVLEKVKDHNEIVAVRIGDPDNISREVREIQLDNIIETETRRIIEFLHSKSRRKHSQDYLYNALQSPNSEQIIQNLILESANLVCGTSTGILQHPEIKMDVYRSKPIFDYLIIDEASKTTFVEFLVPALLASKWILVGDPLQLSPYVDRYKIEGIIKTFLPYEDRRACQTAFWANRHVNSIVQTEDEEFISKLELQADAFDESILNLANLTKETTLERSLELLSSRILIGNLDEIKKVEHLLPSDFGVAEVDEEHDLLVRRQTAWADEQTDDYSEKNWESEVTWRLIRAYEMRQYREEVEKYESQIQTILPVYFDAEKKNQLLQDIQRTGFIALPSIVESLKEGFQFSKLRRIQFPSTLDLGFETDVLTPRYEILTFQHRMHPDISEFPRKYIYKDLDALKDPSNMREERKFPYSHYGSRSEWIDVSVKEKMKQLNPIEVKCVMGEVKLFIDWAKKYSKDDGSKWEIAVITFYKAQENELRKVVREYTGQKTNKFLFDVTNNITIQLGTVDSFQGREADIVFLSFSRNRKVGFLNSTNRLNVAITRPKYQLVIVGDRRHFMRVKKGYLLNDLARETPSTIIWGETNGNRT